MGTVEQYLGVAGIASALLTVVVHRLAASGRRGSPLRRIAAVFAAGVSAAVALGLVWFVFFQREGSRWPWVFPAAASAAVLTSAGVVWGRFDRSWWVVPRTALPVAVLVGVVAWAGSFDDMPVWQRLIPAAGAGVTAALVIGVGARRPGPFMPWTVAVAALLLGPVVVWTGNAKMSTAAGALGTVAVISCVAGLLRPRLLRDDTGSGVGAVAAALPVVGFFAWMYAVGLPTLPVVALAGCCLLPGFGIMADAAWSRRNQCRP